jgi:D-alanyl-D-alanine carboxypeptidase/D-alanyl-D-alanine-endopeptidase (penicillin-binding protein 4)
MKKLVFVAGCLLLVTGSFAQTITQKLQKAYQRFENDSQLKHAISSLYIMDAKTGKVVFDKNSQIGLAPASTQKIITAVTAFELLGKEYRYKTEFGIKSDPEKDLCLWINPSGDPTLGSWRWESTQGKKVLNGILRELKPDDINKCKGIFVRGWNSEQIPDGWIWQDIGNYYGAGASILNWRENQYDLFLRSGDKIGDHVYIIETLPKLHSYEISSWAMSAERGSGDNAYVYFTSAGTNLVVRGTIPVNEKRFRISGSIPNPMNEFIAILQDSLQNKYKWTPTKDVLETYANWGRSSRILFTHYSPTLDSIMYWFLQRSINLYGEALIKTFAFIKSKPELIDTSFATNLTDSGVAIIKKFWKEKGIDEGELNIYDGSGLSPLNRVTTHAQVEILKYARTKDWFPYLYDALPEYNGMKIKSGTIRDVKGFCGYHKSKDGNDYIFSFLVNNYNGSASGLVNKMYKVLDVLK